MIEVATILWSLFLERLSLIFCPFFLMFNISDEGKVLSWGHGGHGQLGNSSVQNQKTPTVVKALTDERVIYIACGGSSSAAITGKMILVFFATALLGLKKFSALKVIDVLHSILHSLRVFRMRYSRSHKLTCI